jgi:hypothetical protein
VLSPASSNSLHLVVRPSLLAKHDVMLCVVMYFQAGVYSQSAKGAPEATWLHCAFVAVPYAALAPLSKRRLAHPMMTGPFHAT